MIEFYWPLVSFPLIFLLGKSRRGCWRFCFYTATSLRIIRKILTRLYRWDARRRTQLLTGNNWNKIAFNLDAIQLLTVLRLIIKIAFTFFYFAQWIVLLYLSCNPWNAKKPFLGFRNEYRIHKYAWELLKNNVSTILVIIALDLIPGSSGRVAITSYLMYFN